MDRKSFADLALADYRVCMVWQSTDEDGDPLSADLVWSEEALADSAVDVFGFVFANWAAVEGLDPGQVGHDFCLTRNRHGVGFWDRGLGELGDRLTDASHTYGEQSGYVGDDGLLYLD